MKECEHPQSRVTTGGKCLDCKRIVRQYNCDCGICSFCRPDVKPKPIDMVLHCPSCGMQHIDAPEPNGQCLCGHLRCDHVGPVGLEMCQRLGGEHPPFGGAFKCKCLNFKAAWDNPPHRSHKCHACGTIWRPADVPTNGVEKIKTRGKADTWPREATNDHA